MKWSMVLSSAIVLVQTLGHLKVVLAPFLFSLYTVECRSTDESCPLVKFADDTELVGKISMMKIHYATSRLKTL